MQPRLGRQLGSATLLFFFTSAAGASTPCLSSGGDIRIADVIDRVELEGIKYVFVGERHSVGPIKRFAVDLANALADRGHDVGLYVEGFRTGCPPLASECQSLARAFNERAFRELLNQARVPVQPIDPAENDRRASRMAVRIARGPEAIKVILAGKTHIVFAGDVTAELWVFGGGLRYPDPGDLAEAFPRAEYLTVGMEFARDGRTPYLLRDDGCHADYMVTTTDTADYWDSPSTDPGVSLAAGVEDPALLPLAAGEADRGAVDARGPRESTVGERCAGRPICAGRPGSRTVRGSVATVYDSAAGSTLETSK